MDIHDCKQEYVLDSESLIRLSTADFSWADLVNGDVEENQSQQGGRDGSSGRRGRIEYVKINAKIHAVVFVEVVKYLDLSLSDCWKASDLKLKNFIASQPYLDQQPLQLNADITNLKRRSRSSAEEVRDEDDEGEGEEEGDDVYGAREGEGAEESKIEKSQSPQSGSHVSPGLSASESSGDAALTADNVYLACTMMFAFFQRLHPRPLPPRRDNDSVPSTSSAKTKKSRPSSASASGESVFEALPERCKSQVFALTDLLMSKCIKECFALPRLVKAVAKGLHPPKKPVSQSQSKSQLRGDVASTVGGIILPSNTSFRAYQRSVVEEDKSGDGGGRREGGGDDDHDDGSIASSDTVTARPIPVEELFPVLAAFLRHDCRSVDMVSAVLDGIVVNSEAQTRRAGGGLEQSTAIDRLAVIRAKSAHSLLFKIQELRGGLLSVVSIQESLSKVSVAMLINR